MRETRRPERRAKLEAIPLYRRIEQDIREKVLNGYWARGGILPSRSKLARDYGVSLLTLEHAIDLLLEAGVLRAEHGRGTFVADVAPAPDGAAELARQAPPGDGGYAGPERRSPRPAPEPAAATIGILSADSPLDHSVVEYDTKTVDWTPLVIRSLERTSSAGGGATRFVQRYRGETAVMSIGEAIASLLAQGVDALAIANVTDTSRMADEVLALIDPALVPVVLLSWENVTGPLPQIVYDNTYAGYQAAQHLIEAGYDRLAFLDLFDFWWARERLDGARAAVQDAGLPPEVLTIYRGDLARSGDVLKRWRAHDEAPGRHAAEGVGYAAGQDVLARDIPEPARLPGRESATGALGIIAPTDSTAYGVRQALLDAGRRPGADVGLVGFDDDPPSSGIGLTTLRPPLEEIGEEAARLLNRMLHGQTAAQQVRLRSHLIIRASTRRG